VVGSHFERHTYFVFVFVILQYFQGKIKNFQKNIFLPKENKKKKQKEFTYYIIL